MSSFIRQQKIILASASLSRQKLLADSGLSFTVIPSHCDEDALKKKLNNEDFFALGLALAAEKAKAVSLNHCGHYIIAADQLCVFNAQILDKPGQHDIAVEHLRLLRGQQHQQISAACIALDGTILWQDYDIAYLTMRALNDATIENYLMSEKPYQSCGAYHYEGQGKWLFSEVKGHDATIQGLPLLALNNALLELGVISL